MAPIPLPSSDIFGGEEEEDDDEVDEFLFSVYICRVLLFETIERKPDPFSLRIITFEPYRMTDASRVLSLYKDEEEERLLFFAIVDAGRGDSDISAYDKRVSHTFTGCID